MTGPLRRTMGAGRRSLSVALAACTLVLGARGTQDAVANGDTRTIELVHTHTQERLRVTFRRDGSFDSNARRHAKELNGAARMVQSWAREIARRRPKTAPKKVEDFSA